MVNHHALGNMVELQDAQKVLKHMYRFQTIENSDSKGAGK